jgi:hypothetical protein
MLVNERVCQEDFLLAVIGWYSFVKLGRQGMPLQRFVKLEGGTCLAGPSANNFLPDCFSGALWAFFYAAGQSPPEERFFHTLSLGFETWRYRIQTAKGSVARESRPREEMVKEMAPCFGDSTHPTWQYPFTFLGRTTRNPGSRQPSRRAALTDADRVNEFHESGCMGSSGDRADSSKTPNWTVYFCSSESILYVAKLAMG